MEFDEMFYELMAQLRAITESYTFGQYKEKGGVLTEEEFGNKKIEFLQKQVNLFNLNKEVDKLAQVLYLS